MYSSSSKIIRSKKKKETKLSYLRELLKNRYLRCRITSKTATSGSFFAKLMASFSNVILSGWKKWGKHERDNNIPLAFVTFYLVMQRDSKRTKNLIYPLSNKSNSKKKVIFQESKGTSWLTWFTIVEEFVSSMINIVTIKNCSNCCFLLLDGRDWE